MALENSLDLDKVYKLFGVCAHHCSNIEYNMALLLHPAKWTKHRVRLDCKKQEMHKVDIKEWGTAYKNFEDALENAGQDIENLYNVSLGNLIKQVNDNYPLTDEQKTYLMEILEKRNYVIHKMWGDYGRRLKDPQVIKDMLRELQTYAVYAELGIIAIIPSPVLCRVKSLQGLISVLGRY